MKSYRDQSVKNCENQEFSSGKRNGSVQGFQPSSILALRTLKADVVTGLRAGQAEQVAQLDPDWMVNGSWGLIQFVAK